MQKKNVLVAPIVKWVGGKRQLIDQITPYLPSKFSTYVEPFLGGGAMLFEIQPKKAIINDFNAELINLYQVVKSEPESLLELLEEHASLNSEDHYYQVRGWDRLDSYASLDNLTRAARILFLNKTCFNGLYRVNRQGYFNVPYGRYKQPNIVNRPSILAVSEYLRQNQVQILCGDYRQVLKGLRKGAFVYLDPPYMPISESAAFTSYTQQGFDWQEQVNLKLECDKLNAKGIKFLLSNSDTPELRELYKDYEIITVKARRAINSNGNRRGEINEILVRNYQ